MGLSSNYSRLLRLSQQPCFYCGVDVAMLIQQQPSAFFFLRRIECHFNLVPISKNHFTFVCLNAAIRSHSKPNSQTICHKIQISLGGHTANDSWVLVHSYCKKCTNIHIRRVSESQIFIYEDSYEIKTARLPAPALYMAVAVLYMYNSMVPKFSRFSRDYSVQSWLLVADLEFLSSKHFNVDVVEFVQEHMILNEKFQVCLKFLQIFQKKKIIDLRLYNSSKK